MNGDACSNWCGWCGRCTSGVPFNATCERCGDDFVKGRDDIGNLCDHCCSERDNYEPPDPDGEEIFRDYHAEARDAMAEARKLK